MGSIDLDEKIRTSLASSGTCDVGALAGLVVDHVRRADDRPLGQSERLSTYALDLGDIVGYLRNHNDRYRSLALRLLLQEHALDVLKQRPALVRRPGGELLVRKRIYDLTGTLHLLAGVMTGRGFEPTGGLVFHTAEDLHNRAAGYVRTAEDLAATGLLIASAWARKGWVAIACGEKGLGPRLEDFEVAEHDYEMAAHAFLSAVWTNSSSTIVGQLRLDSLDMAWSHHRSGRSLPRDYLKSLDEITHGLGRCYTWTGRLEEAKLAFTIQYQIGKRLADPQKRLMAQVHGAVAERHIDCWKAIDLLEQALTIDLPEIDLSERRILRRRVCDAMAQLGELLSEQGATASQQAWLEKEKSLRPRGGSAHDRVIDRRIMSADGWSKTGSGRGRWHGSPNRHVHARNKTLVSEPPHDATKADRKRFRACGDVVTNVHSQNIPELVASLTTLAARLHQQGSRKAHPRLSQDMQQALSMVDNWRPARRVTYISSKLPEQWLKHPKEEALLIAELAWEFAAAYCPADGVRALEAAARIAEDINGAGAQSTRERWQNAASVAEKLGDWQSAVIAYLKTAWCFVEADTASDSGVAAVNAARRATQQMTGGLRRLANLYELTTLLETWRFYPVRIARALASADPASPEGFAVLDLGQGLALSAMRSLNSASAKATLSLQHHEQQLVASLAAPNGTETDNDAAALQRVRGQILEQYSHATESIPLSMLGRGELSGLLSRLGPGAAIIQLAHSRRHVVLSAARLDARGRRPVHHTVDLGAINLVKELQHRMWSEINADLTVNPDPPLAQMQALVEAHEQLVAPIAEFLAEAHSWHIIGQGDLAHIPWHAARSPSDRFLIEDKYIGYAPSLKALTTAGVANSGKALILGWDDNLGAPAEAAELVKLMTDSDVEPVWPGNQEEGFAQLKAANSWRIIHVIAHGQSRQFPNALDSSMEFGSETITAQAVLDSGTSADVVFINACHLARADDFAGDLYGFPFAFLASGTRAVLAPAAPVYRPHASRFARQFHRVMLGDGHPFHAYVRTVRSFLTHPFTRHPVYWAPYLYIGDPAASL